MSEKTFLGCDAGSTSTRAILITSSGRILHRATGAPTNPHATSLPFSLSTLTALLLPLATPTPTALAVCLSGVDTPGVLARYEAHLRRALAVPASTRLLVAHDALAPLGLLVPPDASASLAEFAVVIAGTGSVSVRWRLDKGDAEVVRRVGGWGPVLGDRGSASAIAREVLGVALRVWEGLESGDMAEAEEILRAAVGYFGGGVYGTLREGLEEVVCAVYTGGRGVVAGFAEVACGLAESGSGICLRAFRSSGIEIGVLLRAVGEGVKVCLVGGALGGWKVPGFREGVENGWHGEQVRVGGDAAFGAARLVACLAGDWEGGAEMGADPIAIFGGESES